LHHQRPSKPCRCLFQGNSERPYPPADLISRYSKALGQLRHEKAAIDQTSDKSEHFRQQQLQALATVKQAWGASVLE